MTVIKQLHAAGAALSLGALAVAYFFMERYLLLEPCPLCILDRFVVFAMAVLFAAGFFLSGARAQKALWAGNCAALACGFAVAGRHLWLQNRPVDESALCLSDSESAQGFMEIIRESFSASGDCGAVYWEFAGLSIPEQVVLLFFALAALLAAQGALIFRRR